MNVVITQPTFLPWVGYIAQLASCDFFVCLDNVQYNSRSWQTRNRIITRNGKINFLTVKVKKTSQKTRLDEVLISEDFKSNELINLVKNYYINQKFHKEVLQFLNFLLEKFYKPGAFLCEANINQLKYLKSILNLKCKILKASEIDKNFVWKTPTERLLETSKFLGAKNYLSSFGAKDYMKDELLKFKKVKIKILWQSFKYRPYIKERFKSHLSFIDYLAHFPLNSLKDYCYTCNSYESED